MFALCEEYNPAKLAKNSIVQIKEDGALMRWDGKDLWTRDEYRATKRYPDVVPHLPKQAVLDLEMCVFKTIQTSIPNPTSPNGSVRVSIFENGITKRFLINSAVKAEIAAIQYPGTAYAFDCLSLDGKDLTKEPLRVRQTYLDKLDNIKDAKGISRLIKAESYPYEQFDALRKFTVNYKLEGLVIKDLDAPYIPRRTHAMMKFKHFQSATFNILRWYVTDNNGFKVVVALPNGLEQESVVNSQLHQTQIRNGAKQVVLGFLNYTGEGSLRQPHALDVPNELIIIK